MKLRLEDVDINEIEVIVRGNIADEKVQHIIHLLKANSLTTKIILHDDGKEMICDIAEVLHFESIDRKVFAKTASHQLLCKYTLSEILEMFKSHGIVQIGKSLLVNVHHVQSLQAEFSGNYMITLKNNEKRLVSRFYMKDFRKMIMEM